MARLWQALTLGTAMMALGGWCAHAQVSSSSLPLSSPGSAAVLLPPIGSVLPDEPQRGRRSPTSYPVPEAKLERLSSVQLDAEDLRSVRIAVYDESLKAGGDTVGSIRSHATSDGVSYLTDGHYRSNDYTKPSRTSKARGDDRDIAPRPVDPFAPRGENPGFFEKAGQRIRSIFGQGKDLIEDRRLFESDHAFDGFISPLSNPFYFEDPRSLSEVRPIVLFQTIPGAQSLYQGGNALFVGGQVRLAVTERWSVTINKFGYQSFEGGSNSQLPKGTGLTEFWIGPKYVFYRDKENQSLLTAGTILQAPIGPDSNYQNTGSLSIVPYVSGAMRLFRTDFGTVNGMANAGYSFSTNNQRADFFYTNAHVDFDIANLQRFYPLMELNWFAYTKDGTARNLPFNGRDLANIGTASSGSNLVTWTLGGKYRSPSGRWEFGSGFELPIIGDRNLFQNRFTFDLIWRF